MTIYPGLRSLTARQFDLLQLHGVSFPDSPGTLDVSQGGCFAHSSTSGESNVVIPGGKIYLKHRCRVALGEECMLMQGLHYGHRQKELRTFPHSTLKRLAGNAFNSFCCAATMIVKDAVLATLHARGRRLNGPNQHLSASRTLVESDSDDDW